ncbi:peptide-methionine (S)-S-oxide reductase [Oleiphilus sp. HI0078]|nr:peptide-methionine (S)-S-oxide reductase [Oleiphilus sp. HI0050]KZY59537.1 peptide-methionine (S)-S-oxide reductase [Oleiphilus sp. HI0061]KZY75090.1 peptide-methionine (S)-S-oxide reductase [Oleiphilus sp. HI0068]KZY79002.1 peptide-methionine (S)-S-oxide reductase [Oleiphilus sp. HI0069]KZZ14199.1 peptide-methionine (S)-S-oxide reductase [Oleiphilus sp. HI0078]KZZ32764.1 peptide-methionine (S)-S-oxide reductase [Oleiphilus sp. HI0086]KZZ45841.1 peptide-methionine (S)-S-oxide reductase [Ol
MPMFFKPEKAKMIKPENALPGRDQAISISATHTVTGNSMLPPFPSGIKQAMFGMGCFWGAERKFWSLAGVYSTAVGYSAGFTPNPSYQEVCSGSTGHNEVVLVAYDPSQVSYSDLLKTFWEAHNPTQGMRQGNDQGTQYRSGIYTFNDEQSKLANESLQQYQVALTARGFSEITTEIKQASEFYYAEEYHQQYLDKNPDGYCGLGGCGVELF